MNLHAEIESVASKAKSKSKADVSEYGRLKYFTEYKSASKQLDASSKKAKASMKKLTDDLRSTRAAVAKLKPKAEAACKELQQKIKKGSDKEKKLYLQRLWAQTSTQRALLDLRATNLDDTVAQCQKIDKYL